MFSSGNLSRWTYSMCVGVWAQCGLGGVLGEGVHDAEGVLTLWRLKGFVVSKGGAHWRWAKCDWRDTERECGLRGRAAAVEECALSLHLCVVYVPVPRNGVCYCGNRCVCVIIKNQIIEKPDNVDVEILTASMRCPSAYSFESRRVAQGRATC